MWNRKLCLGLNRQFGITEPEQIRMLCEAGFDGFFTGWQPEAPIAACASLAKELGMVYQSIHAPFTNSAHMWQPDTALGKEALNELLACLHCCEKHEVPIMVVHAFIGFEDHTPTSAGVDRFGRLVQAAAKAGVKIAFENTEGEEYLAELMGAFALENCVGFCWDSGHEMCYNHSQDLLARYGGRLVATHLNDNLGIRDHGGRITFLDDLHLLPFDGIADWRGIAARLNKCGYNGMMTFELNTVSKPNRHENDGYARMPLAEYIAECYKRACRVAALRAG